MIDGTSILRRTAELRYRVFDGEAVVILQRRGEALGLNAIGSRLLDLVDGESAVEELVRRIAGDYEAPREQIERDAVAFLAELVEGGCLEPVPPAAAAEPER